MAIRSFSGGRWTAILIRSVSGPPASGRPSSCPSNHWATISWTKVLSGQRVFGPEFTGDEGVEIQEIGDHLLQAVVSFRASVRNSWASAPVTRGPDCL